MDPITATVEPASPVPPRPPAPTFYALRMWMESGSPPRWWVGYESESRSWVEMMQTKHPGSSLVIIPGEAPNGAA